MIYFRYYIEAYEGATRDITMLEDGAYVRLLRHYYSTERPLPRDLDRVMEIARAIKSDAQAAVRGVLDKYFELRKDGYHNARADAEIAASKSARENGGKGGRPPKSPGGQVGGQTDAGTGNGTEQVTGIATGTRTGEITEKATEGVTEKATGSGQPDKPTSTSTAKPGGDNLDQGRARTRRSAPRGASKGNGEEGLAERNARAAAEAAEEAMRDFDRPAGQPPDELRLGDWWTRPEEVMRRGSETGEEVRENEDFDDYIARVIVASGELTQVLGALTEDMRERVDRVRR